jgi:RNA polymerase sigma-70 factor (ECF subfamily)
MADWQRILDEHGATVWQTAYRLLGNSADAADCLQDTFVSAWEVSRRQRVRNWPGLLRRLATARALDGLRWRARQARRRVDVVDWSQFTDPAADPARDVECREMIARLRCALADLPGQQAEVFCLRVMSGMSYREIASELGIKTSTAGMLLHRARATLRERLSLNSADEEREVDE